jgi:hypothetical protein
MNSQSEYLLLVRFLSNKTRDFKNVANTGLLLWFTAHITLKVLFAGPYSDHLTISGM